MPSKRYSTKSPHGSDAERATSRTMAGVDVGACAVPLRRAWRGVIWVAASPLVALVKFYQLCISPLTPHSCRFTPTCSQYSIEALRKYGPLKGTWLTVRRIARCHPWGGSGYDPIP